MNALWLACLFVVSLPAAAQVESIVTPLSRAHSPQQMGARFRADTQAAADAARRGDLPEARKLLAPVIAYCDQLATPSRDVVSVADVAEYEAFVAASTSGKPVEWVDTACPSAYKMAGFLAIEAKEPETALALLDRTAAIAPYWAEPHAERGYLLNQLGRPQEGLASYERALALVEQFKSNAYLKPLVLRGLGFTWIELHDLDRAEALYRQSLELDPGNSTAERELEYIRQQRKG